MNNNIPFMYTYNDFQPTNTINPYDFDRIINKIERLEKNLRILETRINSIEKNKETNTATINDNPNDMYII